MCLCIPEYKNGHRADQWIANNFGECCYLGTDYASFYIGLSSICCWMFAQAPQLIKNHRRGDVSALSPLFLGQWLLGDILNLSGCLLTNQLPTQTATAIYFVTIDFAMCAQFALFTFKRWRREKREKLLSPHASEAFDAADDLDISGNVDRLGAVEETLPKKPEVVRLAGVAMPGALYFARALAQAVVRDEASAALGGKHPNQSICGETVDPNSAAGRVGLILAWGSGLTYVLSRIPQVIKNVKRQSVEGLAWTMFMCAVLGNLTYGISIFLMGTSEDFIVAHLPYLVGSLGTLCFDFTILSQYIYYTRKRRLSGSFAKIPG